MDTDKLFDSFPAQVEDLINFAQFTKSFEVPLDNGGTVITISLLWDGEVTAVKRKSADYANPQDLMSRSSFIRRETLVQAIDSIGEHKYIDPDPEVNKLLKNQLRSALEKMSSKLVDHFYKNYELLAEYRDAFVDKKLEASKKKFQEELEATIIKPQADSID